MDTLWIHCLGVIALFAFFVALGAFSPWEVGGLSAAVAALAVLWLAHAWWQARHRDPHYHDPASVRARERRGF